MIVCMSFLFYLTPCGGARIAAQRVCFGLASSTLCDELVFFDDIVIEHDESSVRLSSEAQKNAGGWDYRFGAPLLSDLCGAVLLV